MDIIKKFEEIQKRAPSKYRVGSIERIYEIYKKAGLDESGYAPVIIKLTPEEKNKNVQ